MLLKFLFKFKFYQSFFQFIAFASTAGGLRTCDGAQFASLEKYATHFSNPDFVGTESNNAPYTGTGESANNKLQGTFFSKKGVISLLIPTPTSVCRSASFTLVPPKAVWV